MMILALDPGPVRSALVALAPDIDGKTPPRILAHCLEDNARIEAIMVQPWTLEGLQGIHLANSMLVIEQVEAMGMAAAHGVFDTAAFGGRCSGLWKGPWTYLPRRKVKLALLGKMAGKEFKGKNMDALIRHAVISLYSGGTREYTGQFRPAEPIIGTASDPGPLFGIRADEWAALALGLSHLKLGVQPPRVVKKKKRKKKPEAAAPSLLD